MKTPRMAWAMEYVDEKLVEQAAECAPRKKKFVWQKAVALAACLCVLVGIGWMLGREGFSNLSQSGQEDPSKTPDKTVSLMRDYPYYSTAEELVEAADIIMTAKLVKVEYRNLGTEKDPLPYTIYTMEAEQLYKGNVAEKQVLEVRKHGGILGDTEYVVADGSRFEMEIGKQYLCFLSTYEHALPDFVNPSQGIYEYHEDITEYTDGSQIRFTIKKLTK